MQAIILAGGLGTRLRSVVPDLPKPMAPVAGRPFLAWVLDALVAADFRRAVLAVGYRFEAIQDYFGQAYRGLELAYSVESSPLGTGGALRLALDQVSASPVFVFNGDTFLDLDHAAMAAGHRAAGVRLSVAVAPVDDVSRYGALEIHDDRIVGFLEKGSRGPGHINAGVYLVDTDLLAELPSGRACSFEQEVLMGRVAELRPRAHGARGGFIDIGVPEDYDRAQRLFGAMEPTP